MSENAKGSEQLLAWDHPKYSALTIIMGNPSDGATAEAGSIKFTASFQMRDLIPGHRAAAAQWPPTHFPECELIPKLPLRHLGLFHVKATQIMQVLRTRTFKPFLSSVFKFGSASQGVSLIYL